MFRRIIEFLASPGAKGVIEDAAPTQHIIINSNSTGGKAEDTPGETMTVHNVTGYIERSKDNMLDRWLDKIVRASGSEFVFLFMVCGLLSWAFLGIRFGQSEEWAAMISDIQAIISYVFDSLLMRQQLNGYERQVRAAASLRSRTFRQKQMLRQILASDCYRRVLPANVESSHPSESSEMPTENWVGQASNYFAAFLGHVATVCMYWVCIYIWIGFGDYCGWSDRWQLYINSATSALMVLIFTFLANIRERHESYVERCLNAIFEVDSAVELKLRTITLDTTPNPTIAVPGPEMSKVQRAIFYYADVIGTLVGVSILIIVIIAWICIGPVMRWNYNWWLLIGTYAGLVGLFDGFVLRNVQSRLQDYEDAAFQEVKLDDVGIFAEVGLPEPERSDDGSSSINYRLSAAMGVICAHEVTVILGVICVIGLLVGASAMKWTTTGQLLCNVPPSIIESFFMMILITGHNISEARRRADLHEMYVRRLRLLTYVHQLEEDRAKDIGLTEAVVLPSAT